MAPGAGRILGLLAASLDGKLEEQLPPEEWNKRLEELYLFISQMPVDILGPTDQFPVLAFIVNVLLRILDSKRPSTQRQVAIQCLSALVNRHPSDEFVKTILPGTLSQLLNFMSSWEREPMAIIKTVLNCIYIMLTRAFERAEKEGKLSSILGRLAKYCGSMKAGPLASEYGEFLISILQLCKSIKDENILLPIVRGLASLNTYEGDRFGPWEMQLFDSALHNSIAFLYDQPIEKMNMRQVDELAGLVRILPSSLWPTDTLQVIKKTFDHATRQIKVPSYLANLDTFGFDSELGQTVSSILVHLREINAANTFMMPNDLFPTASELLCLGKLLRSTDETIGLLVEWFDSFTGRIITSTEIMEIGREEDIWYLCWCSAVYNIVDIDCGIEFLLRPLLIIRSSLCIPLKDAAQIVGDKMARAHGQVESINDLLTKYGLVLFGQVAADLRYPLLYPRAPLVLGELLRSLDWVELHATELVDLFKELEERAHEYQTFAAFTYSLLQALECCIQVISGKSTPPPKDPKLTTDEEEEEPANAIKTIEEELTISAVNVATHFITSDEERVRLMAMQVIRISTGVFHDRSEVFLPIAAHTWKPLLARVEDPSLNVARAALCTIKEQAMIAGSFLADRVQRELLPLVGKVFTRESSCLDRISSVSTIVALLRGVGRVLPMTIRQTTTMLLSGLTGLSHQEIASLLRCLVEIDADQVWYVLHVQYSSEHLLTHPSGLFATIDCTSYKSPIKDTALIQKLISLDIS